MKATENRRPHALLVVENCWVPQDRRVWNQARTIAANGYDVTVVSPKAKAEGSTAGRERLEGIDIVRFAMPFGGPKKLDFLFEYFWAVAAIHWLAWRVWRKKRFDVVHVANPPDLFFGLKWLFGWRGARFVFDQHDLGLETYQSKFDEEHQDFFTRILRWLEQRSYKAADAVIVTNESYRERAVGRGQLTNDEVFTVRNSPDLSLFRPRSAKPELKDGYSHMVLFVGTMGHQDGVHLLLEAADHVRRTHGRTDVLFVMVGTGDAYDSLREHHDKLDLGDGVRFTGFISDDDMLDYMATADIGAAPDHASPLNHISTMIKTMDYMAMGIPVVSFDLLESRVSAGPAARYADSHTSESFGDAILSLLDDPESRAEMGRLGQERIAGPLSWDRSADQLLAAYQHARGETSSSESDQTVPERSAEVHAIGSTDAESEIPMTPRQRWVRIMTLTVAFVAVATSCTTTSDSLSDGPTVSTAIPADPDVSSTRPEWLFPEEDSATSDTAIPEVGAPETAFPEPFEEELVFASWASAGPNQIAPQFEVLVTDFGAQPDDGVSDSAPFAAAVAEVERRDGPGVVTIPAGTFELTETLHLVTGVTLRGQGTATQLVLDFGDADGPGISATGSAEDSWEPTTAASSPGDLSLAVADTSRFQPGDLVEIEQENDEARMNTRPEWDVDWGEGSAGELNRVVAVEDNALTLLSPLNGNYQPEFSPRVRVLHPVEQVGVEDLTLFRRDEGFGSTIRFQVAADVWVDDVVSQRTSRAHAGFHQVYRCRVQGSVMHDATDFGDGGRAYGVSLARHATGCLIVNNTLYDLRHAIIVQLGASGNVVGYNHARGSAGYEDRQPRADISLHGHWPQANLFEGNVVDRAVSSDWWGPAGPGNTLFRNCVHDYVEVADASNDQVVFANIIGGGGLTIDDSVTDFVVGANSVSGPLIGALEPSAAIDDALFPPSLWTVTPPEFLDEEQWPPITAGNRVGGCDLPAATRLPGGG